MSPAAAQARVQQALELLGRASQDWRNGTAEVPGALHWPVAVSLARRELRQALEALEVAASGRPADAWDAFQTGGLRHG